MKTNKKTIICQVISLSMILGLGMDCLGGPKNKGQTVSVQQQQSTGYSLTKTEKSAAGGTTHTYSNHLGLTLTYNVYTPKGFDLRQQKYETLMQQVPQAQWTPEKAYKTRLQASKDTLLDSPHSFEYRNGTKHGLLPEISDITSAIDKKIASPYRNSDKRLEDTIQHLQQKQFQYKLLGVGRLITLNELYRSRLPEGDAVRDAEMREKTTQLTVQGRKLDKENTLIRYQEYLLNRKASLESIIGPDNLFKKREELVLKKEELERKTQLPELKEKMKIIATLEKKKAEQIEKFQAYYKDNITREEELKPDGPDRIKERVNEYLQKTKEAISDLEGLITRTSYNSEIKSSLEKHRELRITLAEIYRKNPDIDKYENMFLITFSKTAKEVANEREAEKARDARLRLGESQIKEIRKARVDRYLSGVMDPIYFDKRIQEPMKLENARLSRTDGEKIKQEYKSPLREDVLDSVVNSQKYQFE